MGRQNPVAVLSVETSLIRGYARLTELAPSLDHIVPGHDPAVMQAYSAPSAELEGIVVRLDVAPSLTWEELAR